MILNFRQLEVFRAIMIAKTISGAAEILHVSQPGISRLLKYMEYKLGLSLFERNKGRLIPTPEGLELFQEIEPVFDRLEDLDITIKRITQSDDLEFHIACTPSLANNLVPRLIAKVREKMPGFSVKIDSLPNEVIADYIVQRRIDFALAFYRPDHPMLHAETTLGVGLECVVPKDHPLARYEKVDFEDLLQYEIVGYYPETLLGMMLNKAAVKGGLEPKIAVTVRFADDACTMVEQGLGITVAFEMTALPQRYPTLTTIPVQAPKQRLQFLKHSGIPMSNTVKTFYDLAKTEIRTLL